MEALFLILKKIMTNVLIAIYEPFGFALLLAFLMQYFYLYAYRPVNTGKGWKLALSTWIIEFRTNCIFRKLFLLAFFSAMILFRTLLNRNLWLNPLSDVMGGWGIWKMSSDGTKELTTECFDKVDKGLRTFYWTKWSPTSLFYIPLDLVRQETTLFAYPGTKPYTNQYAV